VFLTFNKNSIELCKTPHKISFDSVTIKRELYKTPHKISFDSVAAEHGDLDRETLIMILVQSVDKTSIPYLSKTLMRIWMRFVQEVIRILIMSRTEKPYFHLRRRLNMGRVLLAK
jgi:hypothetical protein